MNQRILIKIGGRAFDSGEGFKDLAKAMKANPEVEIIIVHGGGAEISQALKDAGRQSIFVDGIRITALEDIQIVEKVLSETINRRIANWLSTSGVPCERLSGKTGELLIVEPLVRGGRDFGYVGKIKRVNPNIVLKALAEGKTPVISPISANENGESFNVNADTAAAALAGGAQCTDIVFVTDVPGVMTGGTLLNSLSVQEVKGLIADGSIKGGMVAKMEAAFEALERHVSNVYILQWQGTDTLSEIIKGESTTGTRIYSEKV
jgi:acetylglutamate kinase